MKRFKLRNTTEEEYWKSFTDIMAGLLLVVILIMALLFLYLTQMDWNRDDENGGRGATQDSPTVSHSTEAHEPYTSPTLPTIDIQQNNNNRQQETTYTEPPTEPPTEGMDEIGKAAVFVTVVDEETGNAIKKAGITFELYTDYSRRGGLKKLNTYYPEKIEYNRYETTDNGTFYLPEKISYNKYSLHNLIAPESYGAGEDVDFEIDRAYDWDEPYLLKVPLAPAKNVIRVKTRDSENNEPVEGYVYEVLANEDIVTLDGTLRYSKDEIVDEFVCDDKGYGESKKLYLGNYRIRQKSAPEYYALDRTPINIEVQSKEEIELPVTYVKCDKTAIVVTLTDEYTGEPIKDAVYTLAGSGESSEFTTDVNGTAVIKDLNKETSYELSVESLPDEYRSKSETVRYRVDENGLINAQAQLPVDDTAYVTRMVITVQSMIIGNNLSGENITVLDEDGSLVAQMDSDGMSAMVTGLGEGMYTVKSADKDYAKVTVQVKDESAPAQARIHIWTYADFAVIFLIVLVIAAAVVIVTFIVKRNRVKKKDAQR